MAIAQRSTAALVIVGTVVAGVALTSVPAQAAPAKEVPINAKNVTLTPAQVRSIMGEPQYRAEVQNASNHRVNGLNVFYTQPAGNVALVATSGVHAKTHKILRKDIRSMTPGNQVVKNKYNARSKSGVITMLIALPPSEQPVDENTSVSLAVTIRYTNKTAVAAFAGTASQTGPANPKPAIRNADKASKILAKRFHVTG